MTPETLTPRTDAAEILWNDTGFFVVPADLARQLERENQTFRAAQKACEDCDAPRVDRIAELERELADKDAHADEIYKAAVDLAAKLEDDLAACREWSSKLADVADNLRAELATEREQLVANHEATKLLGKWLEAERALADRLAGELAGIAWLQDAIAPNPAELAVAAWKEARK